MSEIWWNKGDERHRVVFIQYDCDRRPAKVVTEEHWDHSREPWFQAGRNKPTGTCPQYFSIFWSKRFESLYWHNTGGGGDLTIPFSPFVNPLPLSPFWAAPGIVLTKYSKACEQIPVSEDELRVMGYERIAKPIILEGLDGKDTVNPFEAADGDQDCVYCPTCKDDMPDDSLCEHLDWCEQCCEVVFLKGKGHVSLGSENKRPMRHSMRG